MNKQRILQYGVLISLLLTLAVNAAANILPFNGKMTGEISDQYPIYFIPAGYVFSIWTLIYIALIVFAFYQITRKHMKDKPLAAIRGWFILSCLANSLWIVAWHYEHIYASLAIMLVLLLSLLMIYTHVQAHVAQQTATKFWTEEVPFSLYLGWISVATISNVAVALYFAEWGGWGVAPEWWSVVMMGVASLLALGMLKKHNDTVFVLVVMWALAGIAIKFADVLLIRNTGIVLVLLQLTGIFCHIANQQLKKRSPSQQS